MPLHPNDEKETAVGNKNLIDTKLHTGHTRIFSLSRRHETRTTHESLVSFTYLNLPRTADPRPTKGPKDAPRARAAPHRLFRLGLLVEEEDDAVCVFLGCVGCRYRGEGQRAQGSRHVMRVRKDTRMYLYTVAASRPPMSGATHQIQCCRQ